jgi:type III restriction enzyme
MKLHFEPNLEFQQKAIQSTVDLFRGQEICRTEFTVTRTMDPSQQQLIPIQNELGIGNYLQLSDDAIHNNLREIQLYNGLPPSESLTSGDFTIEMETGTGKTYVYLRTIFELNKRYGFTKFVIVVPSIAIKEGVYKTIQMAEEHLKGLYAGVPFDYFIYDSSKLGQVRNFATSPHIQIMIVTVGAINKKDINNLYKDSEKTGGEKPIDLIVATQPIVLVDEPQSVDGGISGAGKAALDKMRPLCTLRYSATHVNKYHMVYRLDAIDAYEKKLVKQIEVASATIEEAHNKPYVRLLSVQSKRGLITAKVELDIETASGVKRKEFFVQDGEKLEEITKRAIYANHKIGTIVAKKGKECMELRYPGGERYIEVGQAYGDVDLLIVQREMIRRTIKEHLEKEKRLIPQGIKVLSLFFIDSVEKYRKYDDAGRQIKGVYANIFEEEFRRLAKNPDYQELFKGVDINKYAEQVHDGYFSIDKKGSWKDTDENNIENRENAERAYNLIMKEKEKLLSLSTPKPLKFIFSHSALREGWDNPNIFQICTLRNIQTERERRQTIGRGLRLCVNQQGIRIHGFEINTLTIVANESYEKFAENLQKEIEADMGIRFGVVEQHQFATITTMGKDGQQTIPIGMDQSKEIWNTLNALGHIDSKGKVQDSLRVALKEDALVLPKSCEVYREKITEILRKLSGRLDIKNADERQTIPLRKEVFASPEFRELWNRIKHKSTYRVQFDNEQLITKCITALREVPPISRTRLLWRKAGLSIAQSGVETTERDGSAAVTLNEDDIDLPDLLTEMQDRTQLTRRTLYRVLSESKRLDDFKRNPQQFIELASDAINFCKQLVLIDGIKYQRVDDSEFYSQELFEEKELTGYLRNLLKDTKKSLYEHIVYDSGVERTFAEELEKNEYVKLFIKLPDWFRVPTPLGTYNPDWAVLIEKDNTEKLYFVVETKGSLNPEDRRDTENAKIKCGEKHFKAIAAEGNPASFITAVTIQDFFSYFLSKNTN